MLTAQLWSLSSFSFKYFAFMVDEKKTVFYFNAKSKVFNLLLLHHIQFSPILWTKRWWYRAMNDNHVDGITFALKRISRFVVLRLNENSSKTIHSFIPSQVHMVAFFDINIAITLYLNTKWAHFLITDHQSPSSIAA